MGLFGFGRGRSTKAKDHVEESGQAPHHPDQPSPTWAPLDAHWSSLGEVEPMVLTHLVNPMFLGGPAWPGTRQAYRVVRTPDTLLMASDGLSDCWPEGPEAGPGFGCEVYLESPDLVGADLDTVMGSWQFGLLRDFAANVAHAGGVSDQLTSYGLLSMEFPDDGSFPEELLSPQGTLGVLIGMPVDGRPDLVQTPVGPVHVIALTVITPAQLDVILERGGEGRRQVAQQRLADGVGHLSLEAH